MVAVMIKGLQLAHVLRHCSKRRRSWPRSPSEVRVPRTLRSSLSALEKELIETICRARHRWDLDLYASSPRRTGLPLTSA